MFRFITLALALSAVASAGRVPGSSNLKYIVGGTTARLTTVPWTLSLRRNNEHFCGATLISQEWAISAAQCTDGESVSSLSLLAGTANRESGGQVRQVSEVINHPEYDSTTLANDISLIKVARAFNLSRRTKPVALPPTGGRLLSGVYGVVSGWGTTAENATSYPTELRSLWISTVDLDSCSRRYDDSLTLNQICAGYWDGRNNICTGDTGGPFVTTTDRVFGIISFSRGCARAQAPAVFTYVPRYVSWIHDNTGL